MNRLPIRVRLTAAFAFAVLLVLVGAGLFVYVRLEEDLDENIDEGLRARADAVAALARRSAPGPAQADSPNRPTAEEGFALVAGPDGRVIDAAGPARPALLPAELRRAQPGAAVFERGVAGIEGRVRVLSRPIDPPGTGARVVAVGQSLDDRDEALANVVTSFAVGGPLAILVASALGYALATVGLSPVEAMRRRAAEVSIAGDGASLPLPAANDEVHRLALTLNDMLERLRRSFDRERRFVDDASHELRTPVAVVRTELEGALRSGDYGPRVAESLVAAIEECDRLAQLADDLLVIARAADGRLPVRVERLDAHALLDGVRQRFAERAARHDRLIAVDAPTELELWADPLRVRQALGNLVDNALRHGAGGVTLAARATDGGVELSVVDGGHGFPPPVAARAFERFTRGEESRTGAGTGLGLAIVRSIAEAHGGSSAIAPSPHGDVRIRLPAPEARWGDEDEAAVEGLTSG